MTISSEPTHTPPKSPSHRPSRDARWSFPLSQGRTLELEAFRPLLLGILNLTPDSFSDGGLWTEPRRAVHRGLEMLEEGADLLDLGAESTRPAGNTYGEGARRVPAELEIERLLPVLESLRKQTDAPLSVDTRKAEVARAALDAGADLINDVTALSDSDLARLVADRGCPVVLMHLRGTLPDIQRHARYEDPVREVRDELEEALRAAEERGVSRGRTIVDPGLGFAKLGPHNRELLRRLEDLRRLGRPILVGASRKSFIGEITGEGPAEREAGSLAAAAWALSGGAALLRVHDVRATRRFVDVWQSIADNRFPGEIPE